MDYFKLIYDANKHRRKEDFLKLLKSNCLSEAVIFGKYVSGSPCDRSIGQVLTVFGYIDLSKKHPLHEFKVNTNLGASEIWTSEYTKFLKKKIDVSG